MTGLGILLLIVVFFWIIWPVIAKWLKRKAMERAEDYMRASMGMPPRDRKKKNTAGASGTYKSTSGYNRERRNPFGPDRYGQEPLIPKEYAEDVEFTETIDYSSTEFREKTSGKTEQYHESQISDAEWIEIKKTRSK